MVIVLGGLLCGGGWLFDVFVLMGLFGFSGCMVVWVGCRLFFGFCELRLGALVL